MIRPAAISIILSGVLALSLAAEEGHKHKGCQAAQSKTCAAQCKGSPEQKAKLQSRLRKCGGKEACEKKCYETCAKECKMDGRTCPRRKGGDESSVAPEKGTPQTMCPVMGGAIDRSKYVDIDGKRVYVCCAACIETIESNAGKYLKQFADAQVALEDAPVQ